MVCAALHLLVSGKLENCFCQYQSGKYDEFIARKCNVLPFTDWFTAESLSMRHTQFVS